MEINFKKVHTGKDLAISSIILLVGVGLFFVNKGIGVIFAVCGLVMFFIYKGGYRKDGKGIVLKKVSKDICKGCRQSVLDYLSGKDVTPEIKEGTEGGSVRLDVYFNEAEAVAYAQLFNFNNYTYEPATEVVELHTPRADKLIQKIK